MSKSTRRKSGWQPQSSVNDGGPAFAEHQQIVTEDGKAHYRKVGGMTLRDYFAAQAMVGMLAYPGDGNGSWQNNATPLGFAGQAYIYADAMLKARAEGNH